MNIIDAVEISNCGILRLLVAVPGTFSRRDAEHALRVAAKNGYTDCVDILLQARINPDAQDPSQTSPIMLCCEYGHHDVLRLLLAARCNVNLKHRSNWTALHFAASHGHDAVITALLAAGAVVNALDSQGNTPLLLAAKNCRETLKAMKILIDSHCDIERRDTHMRTALHYTSYRAIGTELLLSARAVPDVQDVEGNAPIHLAAIEGFDTIVRCLVTYNCDPNLINSYGKMAIHYLAMKGHWVAIEDIARAGGELNHADSEGYIPLWYAVHHNRAWAVKTLLTANCSPDPASDSSPGVPLHAALQNKLYGIAKQLLLAGCSLWPLRDLLVERARRQRDLEALRRSTLFAPVEPTTDPTNENEKEAIEWFHAWLSEPHTLRQICRTRIRCLLRPNACCRDRLEHLPPALQDYISLRELEDHRADGTHF